MNDFPYLNQYTFGDCIPLLQEVTSESVDLIFTSPPDLSQTSYTIEEFKDFLENTIDHFSRIIKPTGFIVISQQDRRVNGEILMNHWWYIKWLQDRYFTVKDEKILIRNKVERTDMYRFTYQYFTCFTKKGKINNHKRSGKWLKDTIVDHEEQVEGQYIWSQDFCEMVITTLTEEGDFVIDPFAGYAPVLYAAKRLNRNYWGSEIEERKYNKDFSYFWKGKLNV